MTTSKIRQFFSLLAVLSAAICHVWCYSTIAVGEVYVINDNGYYNKTVLNFDLPAVPLGVFTGNEFAAQGLTQISGVGTLAGIDTQSNLVSGRSLFVQSPTGNLHVLGTAGDTTVIAESPTYTLKFANDQRRFGASFTDQVAGNFTYQFFHNGVAQDTHQFNIATNASTQVYQFETSFVWNEVKISGGAANDAWGIDNLTFDSQKQLSHMVYREIFPTPTTNDVHRPLSDSGWQVHRTMSATPASNSNTDTANPLIAALNGASLNFEPINSNGGTVAQPGGYMFGGTANNGVPYLYWTDETTIDRDDQEVDRFTFSLNNTSATDQLRVAVEIGGQWYASEDVFSQGNTWGDKEFEFSTDAADWRLLNFVAGSSLSLAGSTLLSDLPDGDITAFGMFSANKTNAQRIDNFTIFATPRTAELAVPEPHSMACWLVLATMFGLIFRRRAATRRAQ